MSSLSTCCFISCTFSSDFRFHIYRNITTLEHCRLIFLNKYNFRKPAVVLCATLWGDLGVTYTVHLWLVGKRVVDFLSVLIELFSPAFTIKAL